jgi:hypothetical protein
MKLIIQRKELEIELNLYNKLFLFSGSNYEFINIIQKILEKLFSMSSVGKFIDNKGILSSIDYIEPDILDLQCLEDIVSSYLFSIGEELKGVDIQVDFKVTEDDVKYLKSYKKLFNRVKEVSYHYALGLLFSRLFTQESYTFIFCNTEYGYDENTFEENLDWFKDAVKDSKETHAFATNSMNLINVINLVYIGATGSQLCKESKKERFGEFYKYLKDTNPNFSKMQGYYITEDTCQPIMLTGGGFDMTPFQTKYNSATKIIERNK